MDPSGMGKMKRLGALALSLVLIVGGGTKWSCASDHGGKQVRPPAVAGMFYPGEAETLRHAALAFLKDAGGVDMPGKIRGLVSPHAGYVYSGIVAGAGYRQIDPSTKTVILLGPSHRVPLRGASIPDVEAYRTPLGDVPLARLASTLRELPFFDSVPEAHKMEHALEVQLPFLQVVLKDFQIVPILTNRGDPKPLAAILAPHVGPKTLVVASSDLSHYHSYETAVSLDRVCTRAICEGKFSEVPVCNPCGEQAILTLMNIADAKGWGARLIDYKNSGDTEGDRNRVVGYASIGFVERKEMSRTMKETLSAQDRKALLKLARSAIESKLLKGTKIERPETPSSALTKNGGCFVTLHKHGGLRGCIGTIEPVSSLVECVESNARNAAFHDPRFPPLVAKDLSEIEIEVSILSAPEELSFEDGEALKRQLEPIVHGVILSRGIHRSTFLPQVWNQLPDKEQFLEHLCLKGGMSPKAWQDPETTVEVYQAEVFGEEDSK